MIAFLNPCVLFFSVLFICIFFFQSFRFKLIQREFKEKPIGQFQNMGSGWSQLCPSGRWNRKEGQLVVLCLNLVALFSPSYFISLLFVPHFSFFITFNQHHYFIWLNTCAPITLLGEKKKSLCGTLYQHVYIFTIA